MCELLAAGEKGQKMGSYLQSIQTAFFFFPIAALFFTLPYIVWNYHKYGSVLGVRILVVYSFILYLISIYFLVILPLPSVEEVKNLTGPRAQLVPFTFVTDMIRESHLVAGDPSTWFSLFNGSLLQVVFNIFMLVPFGMYLRYYFQCTLKKTIFLSFLLSLFFELTQLSGLYFLYPRNYRLFDVDDLMANTFGGLLGYCAVRPFLRVLPTRKQMDAASFSRGLQVSFSRRMVSLFFDLVCAGLLGAVAYKLADLNAAWKLRIPVAVLLGYFLFLPVVLRGRTIGKYLTRTRIVSSCSELTHWYQYFLRYAFLFLGLFLIPYGLNRLILSFFENGKITELACILLRGSVLGGYGLYLAFAAVMMAVQSPLFYEKLSHTKIVSTIACEKEFFRKE